MEVLEILLESSKCIIESLRILWLKPRLEDALNFNRYLHSTVPFRDNSDNTLTVLFREWKTIPDICHFFYTGSIVKFQILHPKIY